MCVLFFFRLPVKRRIYDNGKEGGVSETQEGCPSPLKSAFTAAYTARNNRKGVTPMKYRHEWKHEITAFDVLCLRRRFSLPQKG